VDKYEARNSLLHIASAVSGNAKRQRISILTVNKLTVIIADFNKNLSIFEPNNLTEKNEQNNIKRSYKKTRVLG
jgi:hypothetical protein